MDIHAIYELFTSGFRRRRMQAFQRAFPLGESSAILDVGGTSFNWQLVGATSPVTLLNLEPLPDAGQLPPNYSVLCGDATQLGFGDGAFEVAFSNSVIEHLTTPERQRRFAAEIRRVGQGVWVQTPARSFPVEPHLMTLFLHWLPLRWQRRLVRRFSLWGLLSRPSQQRIDRFLRETRLLSHAEMRELFPDCELRRERFLGLTKAYVAVRLPPRLR